MSPPHKSLSHREYVESVRKRLIPVYIVFKITGMLPMQVTSSKLTPRQSDIYYTIIFFLGYTLLSSYSWWTFPQDPTNVSEPAVVVIAWGSIIVTCQMVMFLVVFRYRYALVRSLNNLALVDQNMADLGVTGRHANIPNMSTILLLFASVISRSLIIVQIVELNVPQMVTTFVATLTKTISKYQFVMLIIPVSVRFKKLNEAVEQLAEYPNTKHQEKQMLRLRELVRIYFKLCNVCKSIHSACSFTLLLSMIQTAVDVYQHIFYLYLVLTRTCRGCQFLHYFCPVLWLLDEVVETLILIYGCEKTMQEGQRIGSLLHKLRRSVSAHCARDIYSYSIDCLHQRIKFDMAGFVGLDYNLLFMFAQVFATYFIISIQFFDAQFPPVE